MLHASRSAVQRMKQTPNPARKLRRPDGRRVYGAAKPGVGCESTFLSCVFLFLFLSLVLDSGLSPDRHKLPDDHLLHLPSARCGPPINAVVGVTPVCRRRSGMSSLQFVPFLTGKWVMPARFSYQPEVIVDPPLRVNELYRKAVRSGIRYSSVGVKGGFVLICYSTCAEKQRTIRGVADP